jgi:hypothetical protein
MSNLDPLAVAGRKSGTWLEALLGIAGLAVLVSYAVVAAAHLRDRFQVNPASGVYAGLAASLNAGTFYPEVYDGENYAGTRYMPLSFVLHAGIARLTGEYLISGKILTTILTAILCAELFFLLRRLGCGRGAALALASLALLNEAGFYAATTIRGDLLPVVLQLAALLVAGSSLTLRRALLAGAFCALAVLSKQTAVWAPLALACWHLRRDWRLTIVFLAATGAAAAGGLFTANALSDGRLFRNMQELSFPGGRDLYCLLPPVVLLWRVTQGGPALAILVPLVLVECIAAVRQRRVSIPHYALCFAVTVLLLIYTDPGTTMNHLVDLSILAVLVVGSLWASLPAAGQVGYGLRPALGVGLAWACYVGWGMILLAPLKDAVACLRSGQTLPCYSARPLTGLAIEDGPVLSDDPWIDLARNRKPCVLDSYSIARWSTARPDLVEPLLRRVQGRAFKQVIVTQQLDKVYPHARFTYAEFYFGRPIVEAVLRNYHLQAKAEDFFVYVPNEHGDADARAER